MMPLKRGFIIGEAFMKQMIPLYFFFSLSILQLSTGKKGAGGSGKFDKKGLEAKVLFAQARRPF